MTEQRYGYTYHRVLIDSTRVLEPQFDDAVIYVTGAQLELLRNMTQYLNRLSTYVSEYKPHYYLSPTVEDYDSIRAIVADLEETLMGNPNTIWGYTDRLYSARASQSTGASPTYVSTVAVPAGYVHVLEWWGLRHTGGTTLSTTLEIDTGSNRPVLYTAPALPSHEWVYQLTNLTLREGDILRLSVQSLPVDLYANLRIWGHIMVVPE